MTTSMLARALALGLMGALPMGAFGTDAHATGRPAIKGVWDSTVSLEGCGGGPVIRSFRALNLFEEDGGLIATSEAVPPPSLGKWRWISGRRFRAQFQFMRLAPDGVFVGMNRVSRVIEVAPDGNSFTGVVSIKVFDITGTLLEEGCAKESATRVF